MDYRVLLFTYCLLGVIVGASATGMIYVVTSAVSATRAAITMASFGSLGACVGAIIVMSQNYDDEIKERVWRRCLLWCAALWGIVVGAWRLAK